MKEQIAEVAGIQRREPLLISGVELARAAESEIADLALRHSSRRQAAVLEAADDRQQDPGRPAARVDIGGLDHLLQEPELIVGVEDREVGLEADQLGVTAQQAGAERMEGAEPEPLDALAEQVRDAEDHLARGLVGEGDREHLIGPRPAGDQKVGEPCREHAGLAGAGACEHQERPVRGLDRGALLRVEAVEMRWCRRGRRCRRQHVRSTAHGTPVVIGRCGRPPPPSQPARLPPTSDP